MSTEFDALQTMDATLASLDDDETRERVLSYLWMKHVSKTTPVATPGVLEGGRDSGPAAPMSSTPAEPRPGYGPRAARWLAKHDLDEAILDQVFAHHEEALELVLDELPGRSRKDRVQSAYLLAGAMRYLEADTADFSDTAARAICRQYDCFDSTNHSKSVKAMKQYLTGSVKAGYTLNALGLKAAAGLIKATGGRGG